MTKLGTLLPAREYIDEFIKHNRQFVGDIEAVDLGQGQLVSLTDMTDEEAEQVAKFFMLLGRPSFRGNLDKV
jgi:hypothetical protein